MNDLGNSIIWKTAAIAAILMLGGNRLSAANITAIDNSDDLDLTGNLVYAINFSPASPNLEVDGTTFQTLTASADVVGASVAPEPIRSFSGTEGFFNQFPALGGDADLNTVLGSFIDSSTADNMDLPQFDVGLDVNSGQAYKLQMLFSEGFFTEAGQRIFDVSIEGTLEVDDLDAFQVLVDAGITPAAETPGAVLVTHDFVAGDNRLDLTFTNSASLSVLSGLTLEAVPEPSGGALTMIGLLGLTSLRRKRKLL